MEHGNRHLITLRQTCNNSNSCTSFKSCSRKSSDSQPGVVVCQRYCCRSEVHTQRHIFCMCWSQHKAVLLPLFYKSAWALFCEGKAREQDSSVRLFASLCRERLQSILTNKKNLKLSACAVQLSTRSPDKKGWEPLLKSSKQRFHSWLSFMWLLKEPQVIVRIFLGLPSIPVFSAAPLKNP